MIKGGVITALCAALSCGPASAKWHYCYFGEAPTGVNTYTDMPPRTFGFGMTLLPATFKRLCGHPGADAEVTYVRRLVVDHLECTANSDVARRIETVLTASRGKAMMEYFGHPRPNTGPQWDAVCQAAADASVANLSFSDTWYFDSSDADAEGKRIRALITAIEDYAVAQEDKR